MSRYRQSSYYGPTNAINFDKLTAQYSSLNGRNTMGNNGVAAPKRPFLNTDSPGSMSSMASPIESIFSDDDDGFSSPISPDIQSVSSSFFFTNDNKNRNSEAPTMPENTFGLPLYDDDYDNSDVFSIHNSSVRKSYSCFIPPKSPQLDNLNKKLKVLIEDKGALEAEIEEEGGSFDNEADCYSFIMDFIVDYDSKNIISIISNNSPFKEPESISRVMENAKTDHKQYSDNGAPSGTVSSQLQQQMSKKINKNSPENNARPYTKNHVSGRQITAQKQRNTHQAALNTPKVRRGPHPQSARVLPHESSMQNVPMISRRIPPPQPCIAPASKFSPYVQNNTVPTAYGSTQSLPLPESNIGQKKTLIYRVIMTKNNIVKNVKRISKSRKSMPTYLFKKDSEAPPLPRSKSMYTDNEKNHMIISQNIQHHVDNNNFDTPKYGGSAPIQSFSKAPPIAANNKNKTLKQKLMRNNNTKSVALTRLSGHYTPLDPSKFQNVSTQQPPLPKLQSIPINKQSVLIKNDQTKAYNLYALDNTKNFQSSTDVENWKNKRNPEAISQNLKIKDSRKFIELNSNSNLVRDNCSDSFKINSTIINTPTPSQTTQMSSPYINGSNYTIKSNASASSRYARKASNSSPVASAPRSGKNIRIRMPENNNFTPKALGGSNMIQSKNITFNSGAGNRKFFYN